MRLREILAVAVLFVATLALPGVAAAQAVAYAAKTSSVHTGPDREYPIVTWVRRGASVDVLGCLPNRAWCEVDVHRVRGWMFAPRLEFVYAQRRLPVPEYYGYFAAPIISFDFNFRDDDRHHRRHGHRHRRHHKD
jgi:uncharacterized protein YraI